jgi:hypothetical protein
VVSTSPNINGFIASIDEDGGCGEIFYRNDEEMGIMNHHLYGPVLGSGRIGGWDLEIYENCHLNDNSMCKLGTSYGTRGPGFEGGQVRFRVIDYEVFKIVIE